MPQTPELLRLVVQAALLVALQLPQEVAVLEVRQLVRQELLEQQVHLLLAAQVAEGAEQTMQVLEAQVAQVVFPEAEAEEVGVVHPQAVLVPMVRLVV